MEKFIFVRTAPYPYKLPQKTLYQSLDETGLQLNDPHLSKVSSATKDRIHFILEKHKPSRFFCSKLIRSQETARLFSKKAESISYLNEIKFSMRDFSSPQDLPGDSFDKKKINRLRYKFSQSLIRDKLQEKQKSILKRLKSFKQILETRDSRGTTLCVSHGFIMKLYENFFRCQCQPHHFSNLVSPHDWKKPPFGFLEGFVVSSEKGLFEVKEL